MSIFFKAPEQSLDNHHRMTTGCCYLSMNLIISIESKNLVFSKKISVGYGKKKE